MLFGHYRTKISRVGVLLSVLALLIVPASQSFAGTIENSGLIVKITAEVDVGGTMHTGEYVFALQGNWTFDGEESWTPVDDEWVSDGDAGLAIVSGSDPGVELAYLNLAQVTAVADPEVALNFSLTAGTYGGTYTVNSALVGFDPLTNTWAYATAAVTVTDRNMNGATLTGLYDGGKAYQAKYNDGATVWTALLDTPLTAAVRGTASADDRRPELPTLSEQIPGTLYNISSQFQFSLSARDSASGTSSFVVGAIPEPATLALVALGAAAMSASRRRRR